MWREGGKERVGMGNTGRKVGGRKLIMSIFRGHLCSFLLPLHFTSAVETLQSISSLKVCHNFVFWGEVSFN